MRKILVALLVCPLVAVAQGPGAGGQDQGAGNARGMGGMGGMGGHGDPARMQKRLRLARTLGLAEALDLDTAQALKLGDTMQKFDDRRQAARRQLHDARETLRKAAGAEKASAAEVDGAIQKIFDARAQLQASDKEMIQAVTKDLPPEKRARAALFLGRFEERIERRVIRMHMQGGPGGMGPGRPGGMGPGMGGGMGGHGPGMGMGGPGAPGDRWSMRSGGPDDESLDMCMGDDCSMGDDE